VSCGVRCRGSPPACSGFRLSARCSPGAPATQPVPPRIALWVNLERERSLKSIPHPAHGHLELVESPAVRRGPPLAARRESIDVTGSGRPARGRLPAAASLLTVPLAPRWRASLRRPAWIRSELFRFQKPAAFARGAARGRLGELGESRTASPKNARRARLGEASQPRRARALRPTASSGVRRSGGAWPRGLRGTQPLPKTPGILDEPVRIRLHGAPPPELDSRRSSNASLRPHHRRTAPCSPDRPTTPRPDGSSPRSSRDGGPSAMV